MASVMPTRFQVVLMKRHAITMPWPLKVTTAACTKMRSVSAAVFAFLTWTATEFATTKTLVSDNMMHWASAMVIAPLTLTAMTFVTMKTLVSASTTCWEFATEIALQMKTAMAFAMTSTPA